MLSEWRLKITKECQTLFVLCKTQQAERRLCWGFTTEMKLHLRELNMKFLHERAKNIIQQWGQQRKNGAKEKEILKNLLVMLQCYAVEIMLLSYLRNWTKSPGIWCGFSFHFGFKKYIQMKIDESRGWKMRPEKFLKNFHAELLVQIIQSSFPIKILSGGWQK